LRPASESLDLPRSVHVVAAAVLDGAGRVLIAQRPEGVHLAGGWEFPGGKLEPDEDRRVGLARELREELGISIKTPRPLIRLRHSYPEREVLLDVWVVRHYDGQPQGLDGQALRWCRQDELAAADLLPADGPIVRVLRLPERLSARSTACYVVRELTPQAGLAHSAGAPGAQLRGLCCAGLRDAQEAQQAGADFVVLRETITPAEIAHLCALVFIPVFVRFQRQIPLEEIWGLGATGTHDLD
jgi:mutator protein MutT